MQPYYDFFTCNTCGLPVEQVVCQQSWYMLHLYITRISLSVPYIVCFRSTFTFIHTFVWCTTHHFRANSARNESFTIIAAQLTFAPHTPYADGYAVHWLLVFAALRIAAYICGAAYIQPIYNYTGKPHIRSFARTRSHSHDTRAGRPIAILMAPCCISSILLHNNYILTCMYVSVCAQHPVYNCINIY